MLTTGGGENAYQKETFFKHTVRDFFAPHEYTAKLCKMRYLAPYVIHGTHMITPQIIAEQREALHEFYKHLATDDWDYRAYMQAENLHQLLIEK